MFSSRYTIYIGWATKAAIETLQKLHELDKKEMLSSEFIDNTEEETNKSTESRGSIDATKSEELLRPLADVPEVTTCIKSPEIGIAPKEVDATVEEENDFHDSKAPIISNKTNAFIFTCSNT